MSYNRRTLSPDSPFAVVSAVLMFLSAALLTVFYAWNSFAATRIPGAPILEIAALYLLPVSCCILMAVMLVTRKNNLLPTILPMMLGVVFFALKAAFTLSTAHCVLCCILYASFAAVYILTVTGIMNSRLPLLLLSAVPFLYHLFVEDIFISRFPTFADFLPELSILLIMLSLFVMTVGMRRGRVY